MIIGVNVIKPHIFVLRIFTPYFRILSKDPFSFYGNTEKISINGNTEFFNIDAKGRTTHFEL